MCSCRHRGHTHTHTHPATDRHTNCRRAGLDATVYDLLNGGVAVAALRDSGAAGALDSLARQPLHSAADVEEVRGGVV